MSKIKTILVGDSQVGKTSLITQYTRKTFDEEYIPTIAGDKSTKEVEVNGKKETLEIWDTAGQEIYRNVNKIFMKGAKIAILVYDMTNEVSFKGLKQWYDEIYEINGKNEIQFGVIANKSDLYEDAKIKAEEGKKYAEGIKAVFCETSAMNYDSVNDAFTNIVKEYVKKIEENKKKQEEKLKEENNKKIEEPKKEEEKNTIKLDPNQLKNSKIKKSGCC